ncbi:hypothetical protein [uncultured Psychroserpens sp.]|uniref:hypothetical protein n=1 Tax=uncultured Psychroserpens sp. TaxID=255436 RepID=UPI002621FF7C|nr:hypothetical protein [uncultured Psychroserpens sp.]
MKHSFRLKRSRLKSIFSEKMGFKKLILENKNDVQNAINSILMYIELEDKLAPVNYTNNFLDNFISFELTLKPDFDKKVFFDSIRKFEGFITD